MEKRIKYVIATFASVSFMAASFYLPAETFLLFTVGWLFFIPAAFFVYLAYGLKGYMRERKYRITVTLKTTEALKALARREAELKREKERLLYEESRIEAKR